MVEGECRLCRLWRPLADSHFLPKFMYKASRTPNERNPNPVILTEKTSGTNSQQVTAKLLCLDCEGRFNNGGEKYVYQQLPKTSEPDARFPLLEQLRASVAFERTELLTAYSAPDVGVDTDKLAYFALSILWRAAVEIWRLPDGGSSSPIDLGQYEDSIRRHLLSEASFPKNVIVMATVCTDYGSRRFFTSPSRMKVEDRQGYAFLARGLHFRVLMGSVLAKKMIDVCCISSEKKPIFVMDCERMLLDTVRSLVKNPPTSGN